MRINYAYRIWAIVILHSALLYNFQVLLNAHKRRTNLDLVHIIWHTSNSNCSLKNTIAHFGKHKRNLVMRIEIKFLNIWKLNRNSCCVSRFSQKSYLKLSFSYFFTPISQNRSWLFPKSVFFLFTFIFTFLSTLSIWWPRIIELC